MQQIDGRFFYSVSDVHGYLECAHLGELERRMALDNAAGPKADAPTELLMSKGVEHEARHLLGLRSTYGNDLLELATRSTHSVAAMQAAEAETFGAMQSGAKIIYQAAFFDGTFVGRADFLRRVERPSTNWEWSYEAIDTKLALQPKPNYLIQLCSYSDHLARLQGVLPHDMHVVLGTGVERHFRVDDYMAYFRRIRSAFLERMSTAPNPTYPFENQHCQACRWRSACAAQRDADDHLSIVAGMRHEQILRFEKAGVTTLAALAEATDERRPSGMADATFGKLRAQASLQHIGRTEHRNVYEVIDHEASSGFGLMPEPSPGDLFFDMEGDPLYAPEHGLEYLFGVYLSDEDEYRAFWARSDREEKAAFEALVDFLTERRERYPRMHVYHYAPYETTALRRLMGYYATREREVDQLLRNQVFVDLYAVARQSLRISQPSYSIKKFEAFYGMVRSTEVQRGDDSIVMFEAWLANGDDAILKDIERYNLDDCRSTYLLREWLLDRRREREEHLGSPIAWRAEPNADAPEIEDRSELVAALLHDVTPPRSLRDIRSAAESVRGRWLLGHLLDYHAREAKPAFWKLYDRYENADRLLEFDSEAIAGLTLREDIAPEKVKQSYIYTYAFPAQQHNLGTDQPFCPDRKGPAGTIVEIDEDRRLLRIKLNKNVSPRALRALIPGVPMDTRGQRAALARIAAAYLDGSLERAHPATLSLLLGRPPRCVPPRIIIQPACVDATNISHLVASLDRTHLVIQGPPGSGKSTTGARVIVDLLAAGKRVAIMANGHKAIHNLLHKVEQTAYERNISFAGLQKYTVGNEGSRYVSTLADPFVTPLGDSSAFKNTPHNLATGTSWLFSREDLAGTYDVLVIDEAGQTSLADAIAVSPAAKNVVLLGDPLQLAQVSQGSHPLGSDLSILTHLLGNDETVDPARGVFLDVSYRMHPSICEFISHAVYADRLHAAPQCANNRIETPGLVGSGLRYMPVRHEGNGRASSEEADAIVTAIVDLLQGTVAVTNRPPRAMTEHDILIVSPYNAQRKRLRTALDRAGLEALRVGTVDKFQGQEAPVVFYSMATSSGAHVPRDLAFLFEKNRINVAISRAQCMSVLVCSPDLLGVHCRTPEQMSLVNLLCAFVEASDGTSSAPVEQKKERAG